MGFGGGGSVTPPPAAEQPIPVPQEDDPKGIEETNRAIAKAKGRDGYEASLLSGTDRGDESSPGTQRKTLIGDLIR